MLTAVACRRRAWAVSGRRWGELALLLIVVRARVLLKVRQWRGGWGGTGKSSEGVVLGGCGGNRARLLFNRVGLVG